MHSSHAALDLAGRKPKAEKIRRLIPITDNNQAAHRVLEVGTGSGAIAQFFSELASPQFDVWAVDVEDQRLVTEGYQFRLYDGQHLPFDDEFFDIVISNHVIEHVGDRAQQASHVAELCRVLKTGGYAYLATPNRWQIIEPHFSLPFLSWIPRQWRDRYVRIAGKGERYDCDLLRPIELQRLLQTTGLPYNNLNVQALIALLALEHPIGLLARVVSRIPRTWLERLRNLSPTMIYLVHKSQSLDKIKVVDRKTMSRAPSQSDHGEQC